MRIYFAHSFSSPGHSARRLMDDPIIAEFMCHMKSMNVDVVDPAEAQIPSTFPSARFEYCLKEIDKADIVLVVATERLGVGVGAEMMYAHMNHRRVFVVCPECSYYRGLSQGEEFVHAFVHALSTRMFGTLDECASEIENLCS